MIIQGKLKCCRQTDLRMHSNATVCFFIDEKPELYLNRFRCFMIIITESLFQNFARIFYMLCVAWHLDQYQRHYSHNHHHSSSWSESTIISKVMLFLFLCNWCCQRNYSLNVLALSAKPTNSHSIIDSETWLLTWEWRVAVIRRLILRNVSESLYHKELKWRHTFDHNQCTLLTRYKQTTLVSVSYCDDYVSMLVLVDQSSSTWSLCEFLSVSDEASSAMTSSPWAAVNMKWK